jgi:hypothetical protein
VYVYPSWLAMVMSAHSQSAVRSEITARSRTRGQVGGLMMSMAEWRAHFNFLDVES